MTEPSAAGLPCRSCGSLQTTVIDSRPRTYLQGGRSNGRMKDPRISRRRKCLECGQRFTTEERYKDDDSEAERIALAQQLRSIAEKIEHTPN